MHVTHIEIDLQALTHNAKVIADSLEGGSRLIACVKADAYGHGIAEAAAAFLRGGASMLAVAFASEGAFLRERFQEEILVLGSANREEAEISISRGLIQTVHSLESLRSISAAADVLGKEARVHLKLETGMNRLGVRPGEELETFVDELERHPNVHVEGIFTHFAKSADSPYTMRQNNRFLAGVTRIRERLGGEFFLHAANSAATLKHSSLHYDFARCGIALYGYPPCRTQLRLKPALSWYSHVTQVHAVSAGETVGYDRTYKAKRDMLVATVPVGYGDGYARSIGNHGFALISGRRAPVIGRVCMDQMMLDVTDMSATPGDAVALLGKQGRATVSADEMAQWCDTIPYEVILRPTTRVPRIYVDES